MYSRLKQYTTLCCTLLLFTTGCTKPADVTEQSQMPVTPWNPPAQKEYHGSQTFNRLIRDGEVTITPIFEYSVSALIVGKKNYHSGWESEISPVDLALAWEELSKPNYNKFVSFSQRSRWYYFRTKQKAPFGKNFVYIRSSNNHIIPHTDNLRRAIKRLKKNDIITLKGYLVRIKGKKKGRSIWWNSSTSRKDTGNGSCEIIYVTSLQKGSNIYK